MTKPKIIQILENIVYAMIGIQNSEASKNQFEQTSLFHYMIAGAVGIAIFAAIIAFIVSLLI